MNKSNSDSRRRAAVAATALLAAALLIVAAIAAHAKRELAAIRDRDRAAVEHVQELARAEYRIVPEPGIGLRHLGRARAQEWRLRLGTNGSFTGGGSDAHASYSAMSMLGLADSAGLRDHLEPDEDATLTDSVLVLQRLIRQLKSQDPRFGKGRVWLSSVDGRDPNTGES